MKTCVYLMGLAALLVCSFGAANNEANCIDDNGVLLCEKRFIFVNKPATWHMALNNCKTQALMDGDRVISSGGSLAVIDTRDEERTFIHTYVDSISNHGNDNSTTAEGTVVYNGIWLDGTYKKDEGIWHKKVNPNKDSRLHESDTNCTYVGADYELLGGNCDYRMKGFVCQYYVH